MKNKMNALINKSELARKIGLTPTAFNLKASGTQNRYFTEAEKERIKQVLFELAKEITSIFLQAMKEKSND